VEILQLTKLILTILIQSCMMRVSIRKIYFTILSTILVNC